MTRARGQVRTMSSDAVTRRHRPDMQIALYMGLLMMLGLVVMFAIGPQRANVLNAAFGADYTDTYFFVRQLLSIGLALGSFVAMAVIPYTKIIEYQRTLLFVGIGACLLLALASLAGWGIAQESYGATRWFDIGPFGLQPSEILKFGILIYMAIFLAARIKDKTLNNWRETLVPLGIVVAVAALLIVVIQRDLGTGVSLLAIVLTMLFMSGMSRKLLLTVCGVVVFAGMLLVFTAPHRMARIATFLQGDETSTSDAGAYHIQHAKIAIGTGGLLGVGIGNSVQATGYLPEAINDSVFAIMGETFGFIGLVATILLFVALLMRLLKVMDHLVDYRLKLLASGVFGWLAAHTILNIGAMIGLMPLTGITLPLLSFGGTSMLFMAAALGLVFQLSRYTVHGSTIKETDNEGFGSRRRVGGSRYASGRGA